VHAAPHHASVTSAEYLAILEVIFQKLLISLPGLHIDRAFFVNFDVLLGHYHPSSSPKTEDEVLII